MRQKTISAQGERSSCEETCESTVSADNVDVFEDDISSGLNYSSDQFNQIDDLDDNVGNYRNFEPLTGIVTSDMRFHEKRKKSEIDDVRISAEPSDEFTKETVVTKSTSEELHIPQPLTMASEGRVLIIDTDLEEALKIAELLNRDGMQCLLCIVGAESGGISVSQLDAFPLVEVGKVKVSGAFGGFTARAAGIDAKSTDLSGFAGRLSGLPGQNGHYFDLVLDLQDSPSYMGGILPLGYYAPAGNLEILGEAMKEIPELKGRFQKPQFISFRKEKCLHGKHRLLECRRCLDICPVSAIEESENEIAVNHYTCQGCGGCSLVCPAEAIEAYNPGEKEVLADLFRQLQEQRAKTGEGVKQNAVLYDRRLKRSLALKTKTEEKNDIICLEVIDIGRIGAAAMLMILAGGAGSLTILCDHTWPANLRYALERQVEFVKTVLAELQFSPELIRLTFCDREQPYSEESSVVSSDTSLLGAFLSPLSIDFDSPITGREVVRIAAGHLAQAKGMDGTAVKLPMDAPFGTVVVSEKCSFCMACVGICPADALEAGGNVPRLLFREDRCHQCGLCMTVCPESAMQLKPRLRCTTENTSSADLLREANAAECVECGKPFASKAMVERMQEKLNGHWMFVNSSQLRRLKMCSECRTRDALLDRGYHEKNT